RVPPERACADGTSSRLRAGFHHLCGGRRADTGYQRPQSDHRGRLTPSPGAAGPGAHRHFRTAQSAGRGRDHICAGTFRSVVITTSSGGIISFGTAEATGIIDPLLVTPAVFPLAFSSFVLRFDSGNAPMAVTLSGAIHVSGA